MEMSAIIDLITETAERLDISVRDDYSGRGMYGRYCIGITGDLSDLVRLVSRVIEDAEEEVPELANIASDSMGYDKIFYWPSLETAPEPSEDDEEELDEEDDDE